MVQPRSALFQVSGDAAVVAGRLDQLDMGVAQRQDGDIDRFGRDRLSRARLPQAPGSRARNGRAASMSSTTMGEVG